MNKIAKYLQSHISGEIVDSTEAREHFSTDGSILSIKPMLVAYPKTTNDIRKIARFSWQLSEKGHILPITARGNGTDTSGAAIGGGIILSTTTHLNKILELDSQQKLIRVQPGVNFKSLQETLQTHGLFLPPFPASYEYSTIGGAIANNSLGKKSFKYGTMRDWVEKLEVVLANGEVIQTGRINKKQVERKKGLPTLEGEIYRAVDAVDAEYGDAFDEYYEQLDLTMDNLGFFMKDVVKRDGSVDLTPLFVGSQGTLGVISEIIIKAATHNPKTKLVVAAFSDTKSVFEAVESVRTLSPSALELVDKSLLKFAAEECSYVLPSEIADDSFAPEAVLFVEFDDTSARIQERKLKRVQRILKDLADRTAVSADPGEQERYWSVRDATAFVLNYARGFKSALPVVEGAAVPAEKLADIWKILPKLSEKYKCSLVFWAHAGDAVVYTYPLFDLSKSTDRGQVLKFMNEYYQIVVKLGGTLAGAGGDGRLRSVFAKLQSGERLIEMTGKVKAAFDPHSSLNPGVKVDTRAQDVTKKMRREYSLARFFDYLPRA